MSILFSSDFHGNSKYELKYFTKETLVKYYRYEKYDSIRYHIILGDSDFLWPGSYHTDLQNYKVLARRHFPILCIQDYHDPFLGMTIFHEVDIGIGETVYQIQSKPFVAYLKRGKANTIDGFNMLVLGGASSIAKERRVPNIMNDGI